MVTEDKDEEKEIPVNKKRKSKLDKGSPATDIRGRHITKVFEFFSYYTNMSWVYSRTEIR